MSRPRISLSKRLKTRVRSRIPVAWRLRGHAALRHRSLGDLWRPLPEVERRLVESAFRDIMGRPADLEDPTTFNEKIQWRKLFDRRPIWSVLVDKLRVRDWVRGRVGDRFLVPLLHVTDAPETLPFETFGRPYILKPTHRSQVVFPIREPDALSPARRQRIVELLHWHVHEPYAVPFVEWPYWDVDPRVIVEELLLDRQGRLPRDYKIHCFDGEPTFVQVHVGRFSDEHTRSTYDPDWNKIEVGTDVYPDGPDVDPPRTLPVLLQVAATLAEDLDYVRVDLYEVDGDVFFGEMTPFQASGLTRFRPRRRDREWGDRWTLPDGAPGRGASPPAPQSRKRHRTR